MDHFSNPLVSRVQGGTAHSGSDLCSSCRWAMLRKGANNGFSETRCGALNHYPIVPTKLATCSMHLDKSRLTIHEMSNIAWVIEAKGKHIGFLSPEELERRRQSGPPAPPTTGFQL